MSTIKENPKKEILTLGQLSQEEKDKLVKLHTHVHEIKVSNKANGTEHYCYIKRPDRNVIGFAFQAHQEKKLVEAGERILENCWVAGDALIKQDDFMYASAAMQALSIIDLPETSILKL